MTRSDRQCMYRQTGEALMIQNAKHVKKKVCPKAVRPQPKYTASNDPKSPYPSSKFANHQVYVSPAHALVQELWHSSSFACMLLSRLIMYSSSSVYSLPSHCPPIHPGPGNSYSPPTRPNGISNVSGKFVSHIIPSQNPLRSLALFQA
jgi:hypothetical protein